MKRKNIFNLLVLLVTAAVVVGCLFLVDTPAAIFGALRRVHPVFLWGALGCMLFYWLFESLALHLTAKRVYPGQRLSDSVSVSMIGQLFNCITPFASGGQPVQAWRLARCGMPLGEASSALLCKFIVYQTVLSVYSLITLLFRFSYFASRVSGFSVLVLVGFCVNFAVVVGLVCICFFPRAAKALGMALIRLLCKARLCKRPQEMTEKLSREIEGFTKSFRLLRRSGWILLGLVVMTVLQLTAFFAASYFVCLALGAREVSAFTVICASAFVLMVSSFVPLPGASGGAEGSFFVLFGLFFPSAGSVALAVLLWRLVTFYLPIAAGSLFWALPQRRQPKLC
ncbi:lysylphosphatidylglycerol synthase transmembrane domain-containing protein [Harryflintia acetispora]|uniref:Phosphatidylglycerol lysyltransferase n=1 Tax=Harryflintia acetispora TaxID=1849041 RepID=A0A9X8UMA4_9FIRM|nr:lysylphosphatidylglycerol synthase transmembrane domain-containing protein [Harryflintia acetispora]TCL45417.1 hypothetical protein EDD78_101400 [Harryflintia acetispora]